MQKYNLIEDGTFFFPKSRFNQDNSLKSINLRLLSAATETSERWHILAGDGSICGYESDDARQDTVWQAEAVKSNAFRLSNAQGNPSGNLGQDIVFKRPGHATLTFWSRSDFYHPNQTATPCTMKIALNNVIQPDITCGTVWEKHTLDFAGVTIPAATTSVTVPLLLSCGADVVPTNTPTLRNVEMVYAFAAVAELLPVGSKSIVYKPNSLVDKLDFLVTDSSASKQILPGAWVTFTLSAGAKDIAFAGGKTSVDVQCDVNGKLTLPAGTLLAAADAQGMLVLTCDGDEALQVGFSKAAASHVISIEPAALKDSQKVTASLPFDMLVNATLAPHDATQIITLTIDDSVANTGTTFHDGKKVFAAAHDGKIWPSLIAGNTCGKVKVIASLGADSAIATIEVTPYPELITATKHILMEQATMQSQRIDLPFVIEGYTTKGNALSPKLPVAECNVEVYLDGVTLMEGITLLQDIHKVSTLTSPTDAQGKTAFAGVSLSVPSTDLRGFDLLWNVTLKDSKRQIVHGGIDVAIPK